AEELASRAGLDVDVHADASCDALDDAVQTGLYRVAQEALTNVIKHSGAQHVSVVLERRDDTLQLIVEDDGCGFDPLKLDSHRMSKLGLAGMRERGAILGGAVAIESTPGKGTTVFIRVPLKPQLHEHG